MGKNQSASGLTNVIQYSNGNITFVSGSTTLMSISSSGAITTTGVISGSNALSASYAANADTLDGLDSTVFTLTSSFNAQTASFTAFTASILAQTASLNSFSASILSYTASQNITNGTFTLTSSFNAQTASFTAFTSSINAFSASILTFTGSAATRLGALESYTSSLNNKTSSFATTGSNTFIGNQVVSGSFTTSGSITSTSTITAQTLVVQTITSSVVYSSGSNIFGNALNNTQTFTGSVLVTGSLTISTGGNVSAPTIFGSTIACSPIGCFATSCATSFIGGTMSGTTIYGSTAVCSANGLLMGNGGVTATCNYLPKFTGTSTIGNSLIYDDNTYVGIGTVTPSSWATKLVIYNNQLTVTGGGYDGIFADSIFFGGNSEGTNYRNKISNSLSATAANQKMKFSVASGATTWVDALILTGTGAATFSSTITGTTIYGSTAVCSPVGKFTSCIDAGSGTFNSADLNTIFVTNPTTTGATIGSGIGFKAYNGTSVDQSAGIILTSNTWSYGTYSANQLSIGADGTGGIALRTACSAPISFFTGCTTAGLSAERMRLCSNGFAYFACELTAKTLGTNDLILNNLNYECANYVDGTRGSWLIQEGACDLFIINQVSCKKYKFNLIEIK